MRKWSSRRTVAFLGLIAVSPLASARGQVEPAFSPVVGPRPGDVAARLVVDSTVAASARPHVSAAAPGAREIGCALALRDPGAGTRYLLLEARRVSDSTTSRTGATRVRVHAEANYLVVPAAENDQTRSPKTS
jgi:hypothetical protein